MGKLIIVCKLSKTPDEHCLQLAPYQKKKKQSNIYFADFFYLAAEKRICRTSNLISVFCRREALSLQRLNDMPQIPRQLVRTLDLESRITTPCWFLIVRS